MTAPAAQKPSGRSLVATLALVWLAFGIYTALQQVSGLLTLASISSWR